MIGGWYPAPIVLTRSRRNRALARFFTEEPLCYGLKPDAL